jgi:hypothetical protein
LSAAAYQKLAPLGTGMLNGSIEVVTALPPASPQPTR